MTAAVIQRSASRCARSSRGGDDPVATGLESFTAAEDRLQLATDLPVKWRGPVDERLVPGEDDRLGKRPVQLAGGRRVQRDAGQVAQDPIAPDDRRARRIDDEATLGVFGRVVVRVGRRGRLRQRRQERRLGRRQFRQFVDPDRPWRRPPPYASWP